ncbi:MAG TPA: alpha-amylase family glycosyl hydrolase, partial [Myxococcales bacterium]|nr:alpha-amylase family glycosyl hydrolase [Myxococcales bacterium]
MFSCRYRDDYQPPLPPEEPDAGPGGGDGGTVVIPPEPKLPWARRAVTYELFVRSFQDSNGDGKGDLPGLISKLDYLNDGDPATTTDLGVDAIWLMPIFASPSYHGYDTTDYDLVEPDYGTNADFQALAVEAHRRGIKVVLDLVINHSGSGHPWFVDSASSSTAARRDWYVWSPTDLGWGQPWNASTSTWHPMNGAWFYGLFWGGMPDLNFRTQAVRDEVKRIAQQWLTRGADGFRLDAVRHLVETGANSGQADTAETHAYLKELAAAVRSTKPDAMMVGEAWADTYTISAYYGSTSAVPGGDEMQLNFNFPLAVEIINAVNGGGGAGIASVIDQARSTYPSGATDAPFLRNHDMQRTGSAFAGSTGKIANALAI